MSADADLIRMANGIAANLAAYPEAEAVAGVTRHIRDFWPARLRERLAALVAAGGDGLTPLALAAGRQLDQVS